MTQWFRIPSDGKEHAGELHLIGWMESAIQNADLSWVGIATCPRCFALVTVTGVYGDNRWAHEQWHARTDFPVPEHLQAGNEKPPD